MTINAHVTALDMSPFQRSTASRRASRLAALGSIGAALLLLGCATSPPSPPAESRPAETPAPQAAASAAPAAGAAAMPERLVRMGQDAEARGLAEPFRGIAYGGAMTPNLFPIRSTGVSTEPVRVAVEAFLASLTPAQLAKATLGVDDH